MAILLLDVDLCTDGSVARRQPLMTTPFDAAAQEARRMIAEHAAVIKEHPSMREILRLQPGLNAIEEMMGQPRTSLGDLLGIADIVSGGSPLSRVRFDDFIGVPALEAAKRYLKKCSDARPFQEIVDAIKSGSGKVENEEELRT